MKANPLKKLTIYDIAEQAKVSPATVSLVLNGKWKSHRISEPTARLILNISQKAEYKINRNARSLRLNQSGLAGMIIPQYTNRFFAGLAEAFESEARARGLCPIVVSAHRDPQNEEEIINSLMAHQIEFLFIVGARSPERLRKMCQKKHIRCVNVDLPGEGPSIVTDNYRGAFNLADRMLKEPLAQRDYESNSLYFIGGLKEDYATSNRVVGFRDAMTNHGLNPSEDHIHICGYEAEGAEFSLKSIHERLDGLPQGIFINSITALEGIVRYLKKLPHENYAEMVIGCFDWDPFASFLSIPILMVRQDTEKLISEAYRMIDEYPSNRETLIMIPPVLIEPECKMA
ncbi:MAG: LacI family DNA-binding transcriptional regulator [SAR324 cluster bacterium]|nr:LacI family DNA-binding transcriptional regulator [SAR324 cluster bacterium]